MEFHKFLLTERFEHAFAFAISRHRFQERKNIPSPYMTHLFSVTALVCENIGFICSDPQKCEEFAMIAMLHDTVEDQGGKEAYNDLLRTFGKFIANGVLMLSDSIPENGHKPPKAIRNQTYLDKVLTDPVEFALISCCDKIHNLRSMYADSLVADSIEEFWSAFSASPEDTIKNYENLYEAFKTRLGTSSRVVKLFRDALDDVIENAFNRLPK